MSDRSDTASTSPAPRSGVLGFLDEPPPPRAPRGRTMSELDAAVLDAEARARTGAWADARPPSFVGLYALCHRMLFKTLPGELESKVEFRSAVRLASGLLARLDNDGDALATFIRWTWVREQKREQWAATKNETRDFRVGYRLQFSPRMITDWKVDVERAKTVRK